MTGTSLIGSFLNRPWGMAMREALRASSVDGPATSEVIAEGLLLAYGSRVTGSGWRTPDSVDRSLARRFFRRAARASADGVRRLHVWITEERVDALLASGVSAVWGNAVRENRRWPWEEVSWGLDVLEHVSKRRRDDLAVRAICAFSRIGALPEEHPEHRSAVDQLGEMARAGCTMGRLVAWAGLVDAAARAGRETDAAVCAEGALDLQPKSALLHRFAGHMLVRAGDLEGGLERYQRAVTLMNRDPRNSLSLAGLQIELGEIDEASKTLEMLPAVDVGEVEGARISGERDLLRAVVAERDGRSAKARRLIASAVQVFSPLGERADVAEILQRLGVDKESFGLRGSSARGGGALPVRHRWGGTEDVAPGLAGGSMSREPRARSWPTRPQETAEVRRSEPPPESAGSAPQGRYVNRGILPGRSPLPDTRSERTPSVEGRDQDHPRRVAERSLAEGGAEPDGAEITRGSGRDGRR